MQQGRPCGAQGLHAAERRFCAQLSALRSDTQCSLL